MYHVMIADRYQLLDPVLERRVEAGPVGESDPAVRYLANRSLRPEDRNRNTEKRWPMAPLGSWRINGSATTCLRDASHSGSRPYQLVRLLTMKKLYYISINSIEI